MDSLATSYVPRPGAAGRNGFLLRVASLAVCLALASCSKEPKAVKHGTPVLCPGCNIILISMDTVRADHVGAYGYTSRPTTPNVDAFAARAAVFENAVSQAAWTLPGHGAMMTGLYPGRLGVTRYPATRILPRSAPMLAEVLQRAGYTTAGFTGGGFVSRHFGFERGFDIYASDGRRFEHNIEEASAWLASNDKRRFFLFLHGYDAHRPYFSHEADKRALGIRSKRRDQTGFCTNRRRARPGDRRLQEIIASYDAAIRMADRFVGSVLDLVRERGLMERTVILVTSDHGEEFFEHGNCDHVRFVYHEILHVPYILHVPGVTDRGKRIADVVPASISVARTLLDIVGVKHDMPGATVVPLLTGKSGSFGVVYSQANSKVGSLGSRGPTIAMTGERYKLISYLDEGVDEAYDLLEDPHEKHVLPRNLGVYAQRASLKNWHGALKPLPKGVRPHRPATDEAGKTKPKRADRPETSPELEEQLRSLGYLD